MNNSCINCVNCTNCNNCNDCVDCVACNFCDLSTNLSHSFSSDYCKDSKYCFSCYYCEGCHYCYACKNCVNCSNCIFCKNLKNTSFNMFCVNGDDQQFFRAFNKQLTKERYADIVEEVTKLLPNWQSAGVAGFWLAVAPTQWEALKKIPEFDKEIVEQITKIKIP